VMVSSVAVDMVFYLLFSLLALGAFLRFLEEPGARWLVLAGLFTGLGYCCNERAGTPGAAVVRGPGAHRERALAAALAHLGGSWRVRRLLCAGQDGSRIGRATRSLRGLRRDRAAPRLLRQERRAQAPLSRPYRLQGLGARVPVHERPPGRRAPRGHGPGAGVGDAAQGPGGADVSGALRHRAGAARLRGHTVQRGGEPGAAGLVLGGPFTPPRGTPGGDRGRAGRDRRPRRRHRRAGRRAGGRGARGRHAPGDLARPGRGGSRPRLPCRRPHGGAAHGLPHLRPLPTRPAHHPEEDPGAAGGGRLARHGPGRGGGARSGRPRPGAACLSRRGVRALVRRGGRELAFDVVVRDAPSRYPPPFWLAAATARGAPSPPRAGGS
jgi:hypothetical protein